MSDHKSVRPIQGVLEHVPGHDARTRLAPGLPDHQDEDREHEGRRPVVGKPGRAGVEERAQARVGRLVARRELAGQAVLRPSPGAAERSECQREDEQDERRPPCRPCLPEVIHQPEARTEQRTRRPLWVGGHIVYAGPSTRSGSQRLPISRGHSYAGLARFEGSPRRGGRRAACGRVGRPPLGPPPILARRHRDRRRRRGH